LWLAENAILTLFMQGEASKSNLSQDELRPASLGSVTAARLGAGLITFYTPHMNGLDNVPTQSVRGFTLSNPSWEGSVQKTTTWSVRGFTLFNPPWEGYFRSKKKKSGSKDSVPRTPKNAATTQNLTQITYLNDFEVVF
jgi:hypothetical protein